MDINIIKFYQNKLKLTDAAIYNEAGISQQAWYQMMKKGKPRLETLEKVAKAMGIEPWLLLKPTTFPRLTSHVSLLTSHVFTK